MSEAQGRLDLRDRAKVFASLEGQVFDVLVIGGGITGAGVARDAAMRGLTVALVEARDFGSGTSSRSSKLIHGGLRYLAQGDLALVREAASERKVVQEIAPHLARETPFVMPARTQATIAKLRAGLWTFEKLGGVPKSRKHEVWSREDLRSREPTIAADDLAGAVVYPEYLTDDARLTLANVRSAAAHGAVVANYAAVESLIIEAGRAVGAVVRDGLPGSDHAARVRARTIINAAGPWVDALRAIEAPGAAPRLMLSKGVHVVAPRARLPIDRTVIIPAADRRSVFAVPKGDVTYIGTTDAFYPELTYWPAIMAEDVAYLLAAAAKAFSTAPLSPSDLVSAWSGVRPLVGEAGKSASEVSRRDEVWTGPAGVVSIAGGKLTAYRRMAERVVDEVEMLLGRKPRASKTAKRPLVAGDVDVEAAVQSLVGRGYGPTDAQRLVALYGAEVSAVEGFAAEGGSADVAAEATFAVLAEGALTLEDYWIRRSARAWFDSDGGVAALAPAAAAMAAQLGWSADEERRQIAACRANLDSRMGFKLQPAPAAV
jgi:glycerol-3-phosphate dehydrogenase